MRAVRFLVSRPALRLVAVLALLTLSLPVAQPTPILAAQSEPDLPTVGVAQPPAAPLADVSAEVGNPSDGIYVRYSIAGYRVTATNKPNDFTGEATGDTVTATGLVRVSMPGPTVTQVSMNAKGVVGMTTVKEVSWPPKGDEGWVGSGQPRRVAELPFEISVPLRPGESGWISIGGCMNGGTAECVSVMANIKRPAGDQSGGAASPTAGTKGSPTPTPAGAAELRANANPLFLPPDGKSQSRVTFTWLENAKPVAGRNVTLGWNGEGTLDKPSATTDANGQVVATYTAPKLAGTGSQKVEVVGRGENGPEGKATILVGVVGVSDLSVYSHADRGGDTIALSAVVTSYHSAALADVPVEFWDGDPSSSGKLLGTRTIASLPANGKASTSTGAANLVDWPIGGNASKRTLTVRIPRVDGFASDAKAPVAERTFTLSNYGAPFKTNVDGYSFENYSRDPHTTEFIEDALAMQVANEKLSDGLRVLSYPSLLQDFAETYGKVGGAHCLGMATSSIAYFRDPTLKPAPGTTYSFSKDDPKVKAQIGLYHVYQMSESFRRALPVGSASSEPESLYALRDYAARRLGDGVPVGIGMFGPSGGHSVVAYQMIEVEEFGIDRLAYYDSNYPYPKLQNGIAWTAAMWPTHGAFRYDDFDRVRIDSDIRMPAGAGAVFADLAKSFARQMLSELTGGLGQLRLITFRGPAEPVLVAPDGKRLGYVNGQPVAEIPGGKIARLLDSYVLVVPTGLNVRLTGKATGDGTVTVGTASPQAGGASSRGIGLALPDPRRLFTPASAATVLFDKAPVKTGETIEMQVSGDQATLATGGRSIQPKARASVDGTALAPKGAPTAAPGAPTATASAKPAGPAATPTFRDTLDGKADSGAASFSGPQSKSGPATRVSDWVSGGDGQAASLAANDAYVGYVGSKLRADQGSVFVRYKPTPNLAGAYAQRQAGWTDYGQYKPPQSGFLMDTIGWNAAPKGSWAVTIDPSAKGNVGFGVWDGSKWHGASWAVPVGWTWDPNHWYDVGVTWGPKGMTILIDGDQKAAVPDVVQVSNSLPFFLGQAPWPWPYGPHSLMGAYDDLRVYGEQVGPFAAGSAAPTAGSSAASATPKPAGDAAALSGVAAKPLLSGTGAIVQWPLGAPAALGGAKPPADGAGGSIGVLVGGAGSTASSTQAAEIPSSLSALSVGGPAAVALGKAVGVPNGDLTGYLPGGQSGAVADTVQKLPGGTGLLCSLPLLLGAGLLAIAAGGLGFLGGRRGRKKSKPALAAAGAGAPAAPPVVRSAAPNGVAGSAPDSPARFCESCGAALIPGARFCEACGTTVR